MGGRDILGIESYLIVIRNEETYVHHWPQISYCGYAKWGIT